MSGDFPARNGSSNRAVDAPTGEHAALDDRVKNGVQLRDSPGKVLYQRFLLACLRETGISSRSLFSLAVIVYSRSHFA